LSGRLTQRIPAGFSRGTELAIFVALLTAALNALWVGYQAGANAVEWDIFAQKYGHRHYDPSVFLLNVRLGAALLIAAAGLLYRRVIGLLISMLALTWVLKEYAWWYLDSLRRLKEMGVSDFAQLQVPDLTYLGKLFGATWWNVIVLVISVALYIWVIKTLIRLFTTLRGERNL
jgi:hypothetical protein